MTPAEIKEQLEKEIGQRLLRAAAFFQDQLQRRLNKSNPKPYKNSSKPGEYPRARTGYGRDSVMYEPTQAKKIGQEQAVRVGYAQGAFYMAILELNRGRLGIEQALKELQPQLAALIVEGEVS